MSDTCVHYWIIDTPNGPVSEATCKLCGSTKKFLNSLPRHKVIRKLKVSK